MILNRLRRKGTVFFTFAGIVFTCLPLFAGDTQSSSNPQLQQNVPVIGPVLDAKKLLSDKGVTLQISYIGDLLANVSGGYRSGAAYKGSLTVGALLDLEKLAGLKGGTFYASTLIPHGESPTNNYIHDFNGVSNIDDPGGARLYEIWYEQKFADDKAAVRIGMLTEGSEFFVSDFSAVFINSTFGTAPLLTLQTFNAPFEPLTAPGIRLRVNATPSLTFLAGIYSGDAGNPTGNNRNGLRISFSRHDGAMALFEADYRVNQQEKSNGLTGTYKLCGFFQTADFPNNSGLGSEDGDYGFCAIVDQQFLQIDKADRSKGIGVFGHVGAAPANRNPVTFYCDAGVNGKGLIPGRDKDVIGVGISFTKLSDELRDASGAPVQSHHETVIEATYNAIINDWLTFQPDFQYVVNPGASTPARNATVIGARFTVTF